MPQSPARRRLLTPDEITFVEELRVGGYLDVEVVADITGLPAECIVASYRLAPGGPLPAHDADHTPAGGPILTRPGQAYPLV